MINKYFIIFMNYINKSRSELILICKENRIKGYSKLKKDEIINLLLSNKISITDNIDNTHDICVYQTMLTCIGNKRKLVKNIRDIIDELRTSLNKDKLNIVDGFAGSSVVSRELSYITDNIYTNDLEYYSIFDGVLLFSKSN